MHLSVRPLVPAGGDGLEHVCKHNCTLYTGNARHDATIR